MKGTSFFSGLSHRPQSLFVLWPWPLQHNSSFWSESGQCDPQSYTETSLFFIFVEIVWPHQSVHDLSLSWDIGQSVWERGGVVDDAPAPHLLGPAFGAPLKPSVKFSLPSHFNCPSEQGIGGFGGAFKSACSAAITSSL